MTLLPNNSEKGCIICRKETVDAGLCNCNDYTVSGEIYRYRPHQTREWIAVEKDLPNEPGRYWCYVEEVNDLGISHYEWNCAWSALHGFTDNLQSVKVTHWTNLLGAPVNESK